MGASAAPPFPRPGNRDGADDEIHGDDQGRPHRSARGELRGEEGSDQHGLEHSREHCNDRGKKNGKFVIPGVVTIKTRQKKATKPGKREIFGKVIMVKAKPAKTIVKAFPAKALKDEF